MARNFTKMMYGPYFPYNHGKKHPKEEYAQKKYNNTIKNIFKFIFKKK